MKRTNRPSGVGRPSAKITENIPTEGKLRYRSRKQQAQQHKAGGHHRFYTNFPVEPALGVLKNVPPEQPDTQLFLTSVNNTVLGFIL